MWTKKTVKERTIYVLDKNRTSEFPAGVEGATFKPPFDKSGSCNIDLEARTFSLNPAPVTLQARILIDGITCNLNVEFCNGQELASLAEETKQKYRQVLDWTRREITKAQVNDSPTKRYLRSFKEDEEHVLSMLKRLEDWKPQDYARIAFVQRGWKNTHEPSEISANAPLSRKELRIVHPILIELVSTLPPLSVPYKSNDYYQELIKNLGSHPSVN